MTLLFVYGTLRRGMRNASLLRKARLIAEKAWISGALYDTGYGYPGLVAGSKRVWGEVYQVTNQELRWIDQLEDYHGTGHPDNLYERITVTVRSPDRQYTAYTYVYVDDTGLKERGTVIPEGDWIDYVRSRR
ncbi:gamma-L-glutamyl-butirosin B gamma-L-glutamyl cyclotransferase [Laceyella tengchongensis]|uniref:Gamma-glutamylcyclotransferase family protein n=1 Tax=Laceyella tengchongensis TaxID=574699 RepID=A0AA46ADN5_9BACL|nr:gamma-glutamylcyclotransferase [Laceyella tengchongensis]SMP06428.1 gamma-L-glutamyl-butirosin B gamma-L-glutamyl cyclotransferase [Laceyella tengchongensis]